MSGRCSCLLEPIAFERIVLPSGKSVKIGKARPLLDVWTGKPVKDTYGGKQVLAIHGKPAFAELAILRILRNDGWNGVWVDTFAHKYRTSYWPKDEVKLPLAQQRLLENIFGKTGSKKGCWDVFCWKGKSCLFIESKRQGEDRLRETQKRWLEAAIGSGLPLTSFLIVEWSPKPTNEKQSPVQNSMSCPLDVVICQSLKSFVSDISNPLWHGREREMVSLYVMGHLLPFCGKTTTLSYPTQVGIEVAVPQVEHVGQRRPKRNVCKDIVIWPEPKMTCWNRDGRTHRYPLVVMEWKTVNEMDDSRTQKRKRAEYQKDVEWLRAMSLLADSFRGYAVWVNRKALRPRLTCTRVTKGTATIDWLVC